MLQKETLNIDTPENVQFDYELAGIGSRFLAAFVDTCAIVLAQLISIIALAFAIGAPADFTNGEFNNIAIALYLLVAFGLLWGYYIFFEAAWNGQTPGKRLVGLRAIRASGLPITFIEVVIRNIVRIIDFMPYGYGVGIVVMFINARSQRVGDIAAGTVVVYDRGAITLQAVQPPAAATGSLTPLVYLMPVAEIARADIEVIEQFLRRQSGLENRERLGVELLRRLCQKIEFQPSELPRDWSDQQRLLRDITIAFRHPELLSTRPIDSAPAPNSSNSDSMIDMALDTD